MAFPGLQQNTRTVDPKNTRVFSVPKDGLGVTLLPVPGLKEVKSVSTGGEYGHLVEIPVQETREIPKDENTIIHRPWTNLVLVNAGTRDAALARRETSNDGIWQPGLVVQVTGVWAD